LEDLASCKWKAISWHKHISKSNHLAPYLSTVCTLPCKKQGLHPPIKGKQPSEFLHMTFSARKEQLKEDMPQQSLKAFQRLEDFPEKKLHRI
jgi:hypothetical protein